MRILHSSSHISTNVWLHLFDFNEKIREKWELHQNTACCFKQILEAESYKRAAVKPITSHLKNSNQHY